MTDNFDYHAVTIERWGDLEKLFGARGACGGCWCMFWRLPNQEFGRMKGEGNRQAMHELIAAGSTPGILAYDHELPVGWVSVGPRQDFPTLGRSRILKPVDDQPVWSVVCFFIAKAFRRQGMSTRLLQAAVTHAAQNGARIVEGYPYDQENNSSPDPFVYTGLLSTFQKAGFVEVLRRSPKRPIMRYYIEQGRQG